MRREHIDPDSLLEYAEGSASAAAAERVRAHLASGCERCAAGLRFWTRALEGLRADASPPPPAAVVERAVALFDRSIHARRERPAPLRERIAAVLLFDSFLQPAPAGARDLGAVERTLRFEAGGFEIALLCEQEGSGWSLAGRIAGGAAPPAGAAAGPWNAAAAGMVTEVDADGTFLLRGLPPGSAQVTLRGEGREIVLPEIDLPGALPPDA